MMSAPLVSQIALVGTLSGLLAPADLILQRLEDADWRVWRTTGRCFPSASWLGGRGCRYAPSGSGPMPACCPAARTASGRRLYDAACVARLELVATLRDLGLGLADVRRVLEGQASIAEVAAVHLDALDAQIRALRLHRSVLAVVVKRVAGNEEMTMMNKLARMSVAEARQMIDDFMAEVFEGLDPREVFARALERGPEPAR